MVADGDPTSLELVTIILMREGFEVLSSPDGGDALSRFLERSPELVVCDHTLPVLDAEFLCGEIRAKSDHTSVVVLVPPHTSADEREEIQENTECDAVLERPFRFSHLREKIAEWGLALESDKPEAIDYSMPVGAPPLAMPEAVAPPELVESAAPLEATPPTPAPDLPPMPVPIALPTEAELAASPPRPLAALQQEAAVGRPSAFGQPPAEIREPAVVDAPPAVQPEPIPEPAPQALPELQPEPMPEALPELQPEPMPEALPELQPEPIPEALPELQPEPISEAMPELQPEPMPEALPEDALPELEMEPVAEELPEIPVEEDLPELALEPMADAPPEGEAEAQPVEALPELQPEPLEEIPEIQPEPILNVPPRGRLEQMPLPRLVFELYVATFSGVLHLRREGLARSIHFKGGVPVRVDSRQLSENLGRLLIDHGAITQAQYDQAQKIGEARGIRQGEALLAIGALSESELLSALHEQTELKLANTFAWRDGEYAIEASPMEGAGLGEVHPLAAIWRGVHQHYDLGSLISFFQHFATKYAVATPLFGVHHETLGPFLRDLGVPKLLGGQTMFAEALNVDTERQREMAQALYVLLVTDSIMPSDAPGAAPQMRGEPEAAKPRKPAVAMSDATKLIAADIAKEYLRLTTCDYFQAIGVDENAAADQVGAAYATLAASWNLDLLPEDLDTESLKRARDIADILARARQVLADPAERKLYIAMQAAKKKQRAVTGEVEPAVAAGPEVHAGPLFAERAYNEGRACMKDGQYAAARLKFEEAVRNDVGEPTYRVALAEAMMQEAADEPSGARPHALALLEQALRLDPAHPEANFLAAGILIDLERKDEARVHLERVLQRAPTHQLARLLLARL